MSQRSALVAAALVFTAAVAGANSPARAGSLLEPGRLASQRLDMPMSGWITGGANEIAGTTVDLDAVPLSRSAAASGIAGPTRLDVLHTWLTSDYMPDASITSHTWYHVESLFAYGGVITDSVAPVSVSVMVNDFYGAPVVTSSFTETPSAPGVNEFVLDLGRYSPGDYRATITVRQGKKVATDRFWMHVVALK